MDFRLSEDQEALVAAVERLAESFSVMPTAYHDFAATSAALERELEEGQYYDVATVAEWGPTCAVMAIERLARTPYAAEIALSMLVRPHLADALRPLALIEHGRPGRFVRGARSILVITQEGIDLVHPGERDTEAVTSLFAYPMGRLKDGFKGTRLNGGTLDTVRVWLRIAIAAEISGLLQAAIAATVTHISQRRQFGRALGTFQALRHRMAECAVLAGSVRWLVLKAAATADPADAAIAAYYAQDSAVRVGYETHQMLGAMGMTLEHPLHLWTYRLKALISELGGRTGHAMTAAEHCFKQAAAGS